jgi:murein DD-endopeptidase MepM/ murein hydrolase activator NlpD
MSYVMIATGTTGRSRIRTLPLKYLMVWGAIAMVSLLSAGAAIGFWLAPTLQPQLLAELKFSHVAQPVYSSQVKPVEQFRQAEQPVQAELPFTLDQLGALSGRMFRLESKTAQLSESLGILNKKETPAIAKKASSGGPLLPPRPIAAQEALDALDEQLESVEKQIKVVSDAMLQRNLELMRKPSRSPINGGELSSLFGNRLDPFTRRPAFHSGLDFVAPTGTPILAAGGGKVSFAGYKPNYGNIIEIDHGNGLSTRYAHASRLLVKQGAIVMPGEKIALVGSTGRSTGPHLHFEVRRNGKFMNPQTYLSKR